MSPHARVDLRTFDFTAQGELMTDQKGGLHPSGAVARRPTRTRAAPLTAYSFLVADTAFLSIARLRLLPGCVHLLRLRCREEP